MRRFTSGTFYDEVAANKAVDDIIALGYSRDQVNVIMSSEARRRFSSEAAAGERRGVVAAPGAAAWRMIEPILASIAAPLFVAGAAMPLAKGASGAVADSVLGALARLGVPPDEAALLEHDIDAGGIVVGVSTRTNDRGAVLHAMRANAARVETVAAR